MTTTGPSEFAWLLKRHGITEDMQLAARAALNSRSREDHRSAIVVAGALAVGAYVVMKVAGLGSNLYSAIAIGAGLVVFSRLFRRAETIVSRSAVNDLIEHTRTQVDFRLLAADIRALDPAVADDLRPVLTVGMQSPSELTRYSILHLWELLRKQAELDQT